MLTTAAPSDTTAMPFVTGSGTGTTAHNSAFVPAVAPSPNSITAVSSHCFFFDFTIVGGADAFGGGGVVVLKQGSGVVPTCVVVPWILALQVYEPVATTTSMSTLWS